MAQSTQPDPQWDFTLAIRAALEMHGRFDAEVDQRDSQGVVDLHWAARQAGRLLGVTVKVVFGDAVGGSEHVVAASVLTVDDGVPERDRARDGLRRLMLSVERLQERPGRRRVGLPGPRGPQPAAFD